MIITLNLICCSTTMDQDSDPTINQNQDSDPTIWYNDDFYDIDKEGKPRITPPRNPTDKVLPEAPKKPIVKNYIITAPTSSTARRLSF